MKITRGMTEPIRVIADAARLVAQGDLTQKIESGSTNELGELARRFNGMVINLRESASRQESRDWFNTAQNEFGDQMRGARKIDSLARNVVRSLPSTCMFRWARSTSLTGHSASNCPEATRSEHTINSPTILALVKAWLAKLLWRKSISS